MNAFLNPYPKTTEASAPCRPKKAAPRRAALCLLLAFLLSFLSAPASLFRQSVVSAASPAVVYVSPAGSDQNAGTKNAPFETLAAAYRALPAAGGTVVLMGDVEPDNPRAWNGAHTAWRGRTDTSAQAKITLSGIDPETGVQYDGARLRYGATGLVCETALEALILEPERTFCFLNTCGYPLTVGADVYSDGFDFVIHDGIGETKRGTVDSVRTVVDGGTVDSIYLGGGYAANTSQGVLGDVRFTMENGTVSRVIVGFNHYNETQTTARIDGNVIITINGGTVGSITQTYINNDTIGGFCALIFNGGTYAPYQLPNAAKGRYIVRIEGGKHGSVAATDAAGHFLVTPKPGYTAFLGETEVSGDVVLPTGESVISFRRNTSGGSDYDGAYLEGDPDGAFRPDSALSRAEALTLCLRIVSDETPAGKVDADLLPFSDVSPSDWYAPAAAFFASYGLFPDAWTAQGALSANRDITRGEFVYFLEALFSELHPTLKLVTFRDVSAQNPYADAIAEAAQSGMVCGFGDGTFRPDDPLTRAEAAVLVNRYTGRAPLEGAADAPFSDTAGHWAEMQIAAAASDLADGIWQRAENARYKMPPAGSGAEAYVKSLYAQAGALSGDAIRAGVDEIADQMKLDVLSAADVEPSEFTGRICYVSELHGSDANDGTTPEKAVKTLARASAIAAGMRAGDAVLFERGGIYRGTMTARSGVTYAAYGTGEKPLLMQSKKNYADPSLWVETGWPNVYRCTDKLTNVGIIGFDHDLFDHSAATYEETYGKIMNLNTLGFTGPADLSEDLQFYSSLPTGVTGSGDLYLYSADGNPGSRFSSIEIGERFNIIGGSPTGAKFDNLALKFTGAHGIGFGTSKDVTVTNCVFSWLGGSVLSIGATGTATNYGNAVEIYGGCNGYYVENNWMYQIYDTGVTHQRSSSTGDCTQEKIRYLSNLIEYVHWGIEFYNAPPTAEQLGGRADTYTRYTRDVHDAYNVLRMGGYGWGSIVRFRTTSARLYCGSTLSDNSDELTEYNIFDRCAGYLINLPANSNEVDDHNIYIQTLGRTLGLLKGTNITCTYDADTQIRNRLGDRNAVVLVVEP